MHCSCHPRAWGQVWERPAIAGPQGQEARGLPCRVSLGSAWRKRAMLQAGLLTMATRNPRGRSFSRELRGASIANSKSSIYQHFPAPGSVLRASSLPPVPPTILRARVLPPFLAGKEGRLGLRLSCIRQTAKGRLRTHTSVFPQTLPRPAPQDAGLVCLCGTSIVCPRWLPRRCKGSNCMLQTFPPHPAAPPTPTRGPQAARFLDQRVR